MSSLRSRIAWRGALATAGVAIVIATIAIFTVRHELRRQVDRELLSDAQRSALRFERLSGGPTPDAIPRRPPIGTNGLPVLGAGPAVQGGTGQNSTGRDERVSRVLNADGKIVLEFQYPSIGITERDRDVASGRRTQSFRDDDSSDTTYRVVTVHIPNSDYAIQVARPTTVIDDTVTQLTWILALCAVGGVTVALASGWWVGRSAARPVIELAEAAAHVADTEDLSVEVPEGGGRELQTLGSSFNRMLRTLEAARQQQRQLIADAGHELRTPLTSLRTNIEVLVSGGELSEDDRHALTDDVRGQLEELTVLVSDLVELARDEVDHRADHVEVALDAVVRAAIDRARRRAGGVTITEAVEPATVQGDAGLLERAVLNLLDNAIKWSPSAGVVEVRASGGRIEIADHGLGIAPEDRSRVFERFWRAPAARSARGSGLGLAIVAQVVASHGGSVEVSETPGGGTTMIVELPTVA